MARHLIRSSSRENTFPPGGFLPQPSSRLQAARRSLVAREQVTISNPHIMETGTPGGRQRILRMAHRRAWKVPHLESRGETEQSIGDIRVESGDEPGDPLH